MVCDRSCGEFDIGPRKDPLRKESTQVKSGGEWKHTDATHELD